MLRITVEEWAQQVVLKLEGKLRGPWVEETEQCWRQVYASHRQTPLLVDLGAVTFVDASGKQLLMRMRQGGSVLVGCGPVIGFIVEEIMSQPVGSN